MPKRLIQITFVILTAFTMLGASTPSTRFDKLGHKLMCTCGCAEILLECNHVGCPDSPGLIAALHHQIDGTGTAAPGQSDSTIFKFFETTYGSTVLASPLRGGFDNVAWIVPFALFIFGIVGVVLLLRLWQRRHTQLPPAVLGSPSPDADALRNRIRNETNYGE
jgi:cytochrome c-type biogenesis protein CcmH/NrfF